MANNFLSGSFVIRPPISHFMTKLQKVANWPFALKISDFGQLAIGHWPLDPPRITQHSLHNDGKN